MLLAVDIGNSLIHFGVFKNNNITAYYSIPTDSVGQVSRYKMLLAELSKKKKIVSCGIACVVPGKLNYLKQAVKAVFKINPMLINPSLNLNMPVKYYNKNSLGTDRFLNAFAAKNLYGFPVIAVSFGTATTFDAVNFKGEYIGGAIAPGMRLFAESLACKTKLLPEVKLKKTGKVIGNNTISCIQSGIMNGNIGLVEYIINGMKKEMGVHINVSGHKNRLKSGLKVVATGGFSHLMKNRTKAIDYFDPYLTLKGINLALKYLSGARRGV